MTADQRMISLHRALGYDRLADDPSGLFAGFVPDLAMTPLRALKKTRDEIRAESSLVVRRVMEFAGPKDAAVHLYVYVGSRSGADARFALAGELAGFSRPLRLESGARLGLRIGDFTTVEARAGSPALIAFGRGNVAILLLGYGDATNLVAAARALDEQLRCSPTFDAAGLLAMLPQVDAFYINAGRIDAHASVPLILLGRCPMGLELVYRFETTHGAVNQVSNEPPRFAYQTGEAAGPQAVTAFVASRAGLVTTRRLEFSVAVGDLGYRPGLKLG